MSLASTPRERAVLRFVRQRGAVTRAEIAASANLSVSQVSRLTSTLRDRELITVERRLGGSEGRPTEVLALASHGRYVVGLDLGGLSQRAVVANLRGEVITSLVTEESLIGARGEFLSHVVRLVHDVLAAAGIVSERVLGLGVGLRAVVDPIRGVITAGPETPGWSPAWMDFAILDELARVLPWEEIQIDDTVRALGIAERRYGQGVDETDFVYVLADTGIGAAIMIGDRPYIGPGRTAGEIGHVTLDPLGERCGCGKFGCLETIASTGALERRARALLDARHHTLAGLIEAEAAHDPVAGEILTLGGEGLGRGLAMLLNLLAPKLVVMGGGAVASRTYLEAAIRVAEAETLRDVGREVRFERSNLGPLAGAAGAATMILDVLFDADEHMTRRGRARVVASHALEGDGT